ncbi:hypothetical protein LTR85_008673 [Meristemomyces frigidus]|nr:hypothetical protein LTR85_008673 [Meristemomyces frigidus]
MDPANAAASTENATAQGIDRQACTVGATTTGDTIQGPGHSDAQPSEDSVPWSKPPEGDPSNSTEASSGLTNEEPLSSGFDLTAASSPTLSRNPASSKGSRRTVSGMLSPSDADSRSLSSSQLGLDEDVVGEEQGKPDAVEQGEGDRMGPQARAHGTEDAEAGMTADSQAAAPAPTPTLVGVLNETIQVMVDAQRESMNAHTVLLARLEAILEKMQRLALPDTSSQ